MTANGYTHYDCLQLYSCYYYCYYYYYYYYYYFYYYRLERGVCMHTCISYKIMVQGAIL